MSICNEQIKSYRSEWYAQHVKKCYMVGIAYDEYVDITNINKSVYINCSQKRKTTLTVDTTFSSNDNNGDKSNNDGDDSSSVCLSK